MLCASVCWSDDRFVFGVLLHFVLASLASLLLVCLMSLHEHLLRALLVGHDSLAQMARVELAVQLAQLSASRSRMLQIMHQRMLRSQSAIASRAGHSIQAS